ncbi:gibberellin 2-beta-dioxygenase 8 [Ricinus communis]|uniref:gibberellin 2beta-dioxygenase n=1 Tax=Ricinus communis TaxID=3988 RepID=B9SA24_RICCO|nr:gibberellin 2-beta-dioxygenase 8 [Ricinus communis]EEF39541.1 gibberellin 20-oxidase, putative [Ricinus communis]|eukprot:XP_002522843.1 gibberellin 2-beta-dioxygenase 8 [Ricinus communis]
MDSDPPFEEYYEVLFKGSLVRAVKINDAEECELPVIDMSSLNSEQVERQNCIEKMGEAAREWGFFQVVNHGIPREVLESMLHEQRKLFYEPFTNKCKENFLNLSANSYFWGNPKATCLRQFSWSEAFHIPVTDISRMDGSRSLRPAIEAFVNAATTLAQSLAEILAENIGVKTSFFKENCTASSSYVRMNRYPPCPVSSQVYGLLPHADSDFLTILYQDQNKGLQLLKDGSWVGVRPNPEALVINIGDFFQAFSNSIYKSIEHRVVVPQEVERFSMAYFYCPSYEAIVESHIKPAKYRNFSFREYKQQIQKDVETTGDKIGLSRFVL